MTVRDMIEQFEIQGTLRIQGLADVYCNYKVYYDADNYDHDLDNHEYDWLDWEIKYMYPTNYKTDTLGTWGVVPQIVIEIDDEDK